MAASLFFLYIYPIYIYIFFGQAQTTRSVCHPEQLRWASCSTQVSIALQSNHASREQDGVEQGFLGMYDAWGEESRPSTRDLAIAITIAASSRVFQCVYM